MPLVLDTNPADIIDRVLKKIKRTYRDVQRARWRKKIMQTDPAPAVDPSAFSYRIHMLMCKTDLAMGICACKSLILATTSPQPFIFHDDGSLNEADIRVLVSQLPGTKVISYAQSTQRAEKQFGATSRIFSYRQKGVMLLKLLDVKLFAETEKVIIMDSDILFFRNPADLLAKAVDRTAPNAFNKDITSAYMTDLKILERLSGKELLPEINAGLSVVNVNTIDFNKIDTWLEQLQDQPIILHRIEQSFMAMLSAVSGYHTEYLSSPYDVSYFKEPDTAICKHYVGRIRFGFEIEGIQYLWENGFAKNWFALTQKNIINAYG
jgi:hypothetical protein